MGDVLNDILNQQNEFAMDKSRFYPGGGAAQTSEDDTANKENNIVVDYAKKVQEQKQPQPEVEQPQRLTYTDMFKRFNPEPKQEVDEKTQKNRMLMASIGDALSAFHTAYANARGVKPMVNPGESLTGRMRERYDRLNKEYEARKKEYGSGLMRAQQMDAEYDISLEQLKERREQRKEANKIQREKMVQQEKVNEARNNYWKAVAEKNTEQAEYWRLMAEGVPDATAAKIAKDRALAAKASGNGGSGKKNNGYKTIKRIEKDENGNDIIVTEKIPTGTSGGNNGSRVGNLLPNMNQKPKRLIPTN